MAIHSLEIRSARLCISPTARLCIPPPTHQPQTQCQHFLSYYSFCQAQPSSNNHNYCDKGELRRFFYTQSYKKPLFSEKVRSYTTILSHMGFYGATRVCIFTYIFWHVFVTDYVCYLSRLETHVMAHH